MFLCRNVVLFGAFAARGGRCARLLQPAGAFPAGGAAPGGPTRPRRAGGVRVAHARGTSRPESALPYIARSTGCLGCDLTPLGEMLQCLCLVYARTFIPSPGAVGMFLMSAQAAKPARSPPRETTGKGAQGAVALRPHAGRCAQSFSTELVEPTPNF